MTPKDASIFFPFQPPQTVSMYISDNNQSVSLHADKLFLRFIKQMAVDAFWCYLSSLKLRSSFIELTLFANWLIWTCINQVWPISSRVFGHRFTEPSSSLLRCLVFLTIWDGTLLQRGRYDEMVQISILS